MNDEEVVRHICWTLHDAVKLLNAFNIVFLMEVHTKLTRIGYRWLRLFAWLSNSRVNLLIFTSLRVHLSSIS